MSAIAILDFGGANELFHQMSVLAQQGRLDYQAHASQEPGGDNMPPPDMDPMVSPGKCSALSSWNLATIQWRPLSVGYL